MMKKRNTSPLKTNPFVVGLWMLDDCADINPRFLLQISILTEALNYRISTLPNQHINTSSFGMA
ncbi:hypothetical protein QGN23_01080 [Chryseobacterium gotjawalense]|uniref:Uncharacterized protein n=1 Tax=Chryseobacterium gotjawalense TaxID=3042315 RepID=A0ABY8RDE6_9FLAO|nr:hypothetical protein [Chryseobacterium sp. wdc7]WHF51886.1 hypothetical protein QGN23_01080 [Chryseobacterium sp. wdc7]